jgi:ABC-2 type transport system permease protein
MEELDETFARAIQERMRRPDRARIFSSRDLDASRMTVLLRSLGGLLTSRCHASVLSMAAGVPQVAVGHDLRLRTLFEGWISIVASSPPEPRVISWGTPPIWTRSSMTRPRRTRPRRRRMKRELAPRAALLGTVFRKTILDQWRAIWWWALGIVGSVFMYSGFWPTVRDNASQFDTYLKNLPEAIRSLIGSDYATPAGYLRSELFSFLGPVLLLVYAIGNGARSLAGEEEAGTLDLLLSTPVAHRRVYLDTFRAMAGLTALLAMLVWLGVEVLGPPFGLTVPVANLTASVLNLLLLAVGFGSLAQTMGAASGRKGVAIGVASGAALVTFLVNTLAVSVRALEPFSLLSPFRYYSGHQPIQTGFHLVDVLVLALIPAVCVAVGLVVFERRDLAT